MISGERLKEIRQETDLTTRRKRLENHHISAIFVGGETSTDNQFPLTLPEHAYAHFIEARRSANWDVASGHFWATRKIVERMGGVEKGEFDRMINTFNRRKRCIIY
jgi:hypothetical protein